MTEKASNLQQLHVSKVSVLEQVQENWPIHVYLEIVVKRRCWWWHGGSVCVCLNSVKSAVKPQLVV